MKPMLPTLAFDVPLGKEWVYEVKYDGFRAFIEMNQYGMKLTSRNGKDLLPQFPEASLFFHHYKEKLDPLIPIVLDGELVILENPYKSNFFQMQTRGRTRSLKRINEFMQHNRATFLAFDILCYQGKSLVNEPFLKRKEYLNKLIFDLGLPTEPKPTQPYFIQPISYDPDFTSIWRRVKQSDGEGIIAKRVDSTWEEGKRTTHWIKYKNWRKLHCFITKFDKQNGYFHVGVYKNGTVFPVGLFKNGMNQEEYHALFQTIKTNATKEDEQFLHVDPSICVELFYLQIYEGTLREPYFSRFLFQTKPIECLVDQLHDIIRDFPIEITHPEKPLYEKKQITKLDYISYLKQIFPYMSPFLINRPLTVIRYPHGIFGEAFFQKNCPDYAPEFVETYRQDDIQYILCNNYETFIWLGNQLAIEFHLPFYTIDKKGPTEIVIDLDPPTKKEFSLAVEAATYIKEDIIDKLGLHAFLKVSGNRGIQIYFPLSGERISWEMAKKFTEFVATYLVTKKPAHFTIERLKKNRGNKLYVDYVQHGEGKTIIAPFSIRGNENAGVAMPIYWSELSTILKPDGFSMKDVVNRIESKGNPFASFFQVNNEEPFQAIIEFLRRRS